MEERRRCEAGEVKGAEKPGLEFVDEHLSMVAGEDMNEGGEVGKVEEGRKVEKNVKGEPFEGQHGVRAHVHAWGVGGGVCACAEAERARTGPQTTRRCAPRAACGP